MVWYSLDDPPNDSELNVGSSDKWSKRGSKKHKKDGCAVDASKIKCFSCGGLGHIGANCPAKSWAKGKGEGKGRGKAVKERRQAKEAKEKEKRKGLVRKAN